MILKLVIGLAVVVVLLVVGLVILGAVAQWASLRPSENPHENQTPY